MLLLLLWLEIEQMSKPSLKSLYRAQASHVLQSLMGLEVASVVSSILIRSTLQDLGLGPSPGLPQDPQLLAQREKELQ